MTNKEFIESIATSVRSDMATSGILASITIAQACLESAYGESELAVKAYNLFGMKATLSGNTWSSDWDCSTYSKQTKEQDANGKEYTITADFRKYASWAASIKDHSDYLNGAMNGSTLRYAGLSGCTNYRSAAQLIKDGGYATDIDYVDNLCKVIENNNLTQYDNNDGGNNMQITDALLTISNYNRPGTKRSSTTAIACHYIGNPGTSAQANRNYFESLKNGQGTKASCHYIIGLQGEILRLIPEDEISWCTNQANSYTISIEACHPDNSGKFNDATYESYVALCADLCSRWGLDPVNGGLIRHYDVTGKVCPKYFVDHPDAWTQFKAEVAAAMTVKEKKSGWCEENGGWRFYLGDTGTYVANDWYQDGGDWYWFDGDGMMVADNWKTDSNDKWYYLTPSGAVAKNKWAIWNEELYRLTEDGSMYEGRVILDSDEKGALQIFDSRSNDLGYIKDGLFFCLDGVQNTRNGHDKNVTTYWHDISGNNNDPILGGGVLTSGDTYCEIQGSYLAIRKPENGWMPMTFQIVCQTDENTDGSRKIFPAFAPTVAGYGSASSFHIGVAEDNMYGINLNGNSIFHSISVEKTQKAAFSIIAGEVYKGYDNYERLDSKAYFNGGLVSIRNDSIYLYESKYIYLGRGYDSSSAIPWKGKIYSVRIYNRELSQEELDYNYMVDKVRFNIQ